MYLPGAFYISFVLIEFSVLLCDSMLFVNHPKWLKLHLQVNWFDLIPCIFIYLCILYKKPCIPFIF